MASSGEEAAIEEAMQRFAGESLASLRRMLVSRGGAEARAIRRLIAAAVEKEEEEEAAFGLTREPAHAGDRVGEYGFENFVQRYRSGGADVQTRIFHRPSMREIGVVDVTTRNGNMELVLVRIDDTGHRRRGIARPAILRALTLASEKGDPAKTFSVSVQPDYPEMEYPLRHLYTDVAKALHVMPTSDRLWIESEGFHAGRRFHEIGGRMFSPSVFSDLERKAYDRAREHAATASEREDIDRHQKLVAHHPFARPPRPSTTASEDDGAGSMTGAESDAGEDDSRKKRRVDKVDEESEVASDK